jgi:hypothetical protein
MAGAHFGDVLGPSSSGGGVIIARSARCLRRWGCPRTGVIVLGSQRVLRFFSAETAGARGRVIVVKAERLGVFGPQNVRIRRKFPLHLEVDGRYPFVIPRLVRNEVGRVPSGAG